MSYTSRMVKIKCDYCKKEYFTYPCRLKRSNKYNYCSYKCSGLARKNNIKVNKKTRKKLSIHMKQLWKDGKLKPKSAWNKGTKGIMKAWNKGLFGYLAGKKHYNWQGGKSFEPYGVEFNNKLREIIRKRDGYICQECKYTERELRYKLDVHHIDYNKKNNKLSNLISLCRSCHMKTNFNREDWTNYFQ